MSKSIYNSEWIEQYSTKEFENKYTYEGSDLGMTYGKTATVFRLWSPFAKQVRLNLYNNGDINNGERIDSVLMDKKDRGIWETSVAGDIDGIYYTYSVDFGDYVNELCDPYAKACGVNGKRAMVVNLEDTNPEGWHNDRNPNEKLPWCKSFIYEMHVRDLSSDKSSGISHKGKFLGVAESGTTVNREGKISTGLDHIKELGMTHVHLLPSYDYATIDESKEFSAEEYNWGYDPLNYNVPEGSYSTNPYDGKVRIRELKKTIQTLHNNGISVILDVVYNHTFNEEFCFNKAVPGYFYRVDVDGIFSNGSACGNDTASERSMVSKYIVDSVLYWAREYHIDGFRFDLVGLLDVDTINTIREGLDQIRPNIIMYGEGWTLDTKLTKENVELAVQDNVCKMKNFAMFSDDIRDAIKGSVFEETEKGFISGNTESVEVIKKSIMGLPDWSEKPCQVINYTSCHDNYTLFDKIRLCNEKIDFAHAVRQNLLAISIVMLSQGIPLIHAGEEILRTKTGKDGQYISDSVRACDEVNSIKWDTLLEEDYYNVYQYYKGLIELRKSNDLFTLETKEQVVNHIKFVDTDCKEVVAYILSDDSYEFIIVFNSSDSSYPLNLNEISLKQSDDVSKYEVIVNENKAGTENLAECHEKINVAPVSCMVLRKCNITA